MTSRVSFFKGMLQDLRYRVWMIALSCLGSFLAMPVFYLLLQQDWNERIRRAYEYSETEFDILEFKLESVIGCFREGFSVTGGIILVAGALIVAIFGFYYVFSKKMMDQYHSIPIKRKNLFLIHYINGFLIWFVPMVISALASGFLAMLFLKDFPSWCLAMAELAKFIGNATIAFLLVYNVAIVAVMLSGNVINTLVNGAMISFGVLAMSTMYQGFAGIYFNTYYSDVYGYTLQKTIWASPIPSAIYQMIMSATDLYLWPVVVMNLVVIAVLWVAGFVLYLKRPSELAEQGMKLKSVQIILKTIWTVLAGLIGWMLFELMGYGTEWSIFGLVLTGGLCYGVLDILFHMDFKAFFAHKVQMAATIAVTIFIGLIFEKDLLGYDTYLPQKEEIAEIGIVVNGYSNVRSQYIYDGKWSEKNRLDTMDYTDKDTAYAFLEEAVCGSDSGKYTRTVTVSVRVTRQNGTTYYRTYNMDAYNDAVMMPILTSESYLETNVFIPEEIIREVSDDSIFFDENTRFWLESFEYTQDVMDNQFAVQLMEAYNADMQEAPDTYFYQTGEVICCMAYRGYDRESDRNYHLELDIYDSMHRTKAVLEKYFYDSTIGLPSAEELHYIEIVVYNQGEENLRQMLGLEAWDGVTDKDYEVYTSDNVNGYGADVELAETKQILESTFTARFTDKAEIEELLSVISYQSPSRWAVFNREPLISGEVRLCYKENNFCYADLKKGKLPEKFVDDFRMATY